ncbi:MAG: hypothetical protein HZA37_00050 [Parcubacteria group bacterium]|nr:hypothetical protein [Parcubacteria group bacterium]
MEIIFLTMKAAIVPAAILISAYSFAVVDFKKAVKFSTAIGLFSLSVAFFGAENLLLSSYGLSGEGVDIVKHLFVYAGMVFFYLFLSDCLSGHCPKNKGSSG